MKTVNSAGFALLKNDGSLKVLLGHSFTGKNPVLEDRKWGIPKGKQDPGESLLNCAIREFYEETGLKIDKRFYIFGQECKEPQPLIAHSYFTREKGQKVRKNLYVFLAYDFLAASKDFEFISKKNLSGNPELDLFFWCDLDVAQNIVTYSQSNIFAEIVRIKTIFKK